MSFYITTPIYYVNDVPHIGHAYTTVVADVLTRYHKLFGEEVFFLTGTDEHGQKVQQAAQKNNMEPQAYVDSIVVRFKEAWQELGIHHSHFIRTTDEHHKKYVQDCLQKLWDRDEIYIQEYEGLYAVSEEVFYTEKDLVNGKTPFGNEVQKVKERNYFFKMSKYRDRLIQHIQDNPSFIQPDFRRNEVLGFLKQELGDLCISRPKSRLSWGIELPFDKEFVTYVWFDALLNYVSALKLGADSKNYEKFWKEAVHLIGKDILTTHTVYWPTMLMALELPLPKQIFAHGWWLMEGNQKMSKSLGNVVKPLDMKNLVGVDSFRYFLTRDIYLGNDAQFSADLVISRVNSELANNLGNLLSRSTNLVDKFFGGQVPSNTTSNTSSGMAHPAALGTLNRTLIDTVKGTQELINLAEGTAEKVKNDIKKMAPNLAIGHVIDLLSAANKYLEDTAPWKAAKIELKTPGFVLYNALEVLRIAGILLSPVMPEKTQELLKRIGWEKESNFEDAKSWGLLKPGAKVTKGDPLFPRIESQVV